MEIKKRKTKKILIIRNDHIGDLILSSGIFREIKKTIPNSEITVVTAPISKEIVETNPYIDEIITCNYNPKSWGDFVEFYRAYKKIKKGKFDYGLELRGDLSNIFGLLFLSKVKYKAGHYKNKLSKILLDFPRPNNSCFEHESKRSINMFNECFKIADIDYSPQIFLTEDDKREVNKFIKKNNLKKFICIAPETPHLGKQWPLEKFDKVIKFLNKNYPKHKIILVGSDKYKLNWLKNKNLNLIILIRPKLRFVYGLFKKSSMVLSLDIGPMHIAWTGNCKLLGIILKFSEPSIENIKPLGKNSRYLLEREINTKITVNEVKRELRKILG
ncbi:MAG: glycosyltransferase family 9 protein [Nanoarchaeota archaeon]|nr:glycosyltransferase family 9 protein [Nanoarchaeota archaeon]